MKIDINADKKVSFEEIHEQGMDQRIEENLAIGIAWIGHTLDPHYQPHQKIIDEVVKYPSSLDSESEMEDNSEIYPWYELTHLGEPICLSEHLSELTEDKQIHIIHLDDYQSDLGL